jgi:hypothetical protein
MVRVIEGNKQNKKTAVSEARFIYGVFLIFNIFFREYVAPEILDGGRW